MEKYIKNKMETVTKKHKRSRQPVPAARPIHPVTNPLAAQPPPRAARHAAHARVKWKTMCPGPAERFRRGTRSVCLWGGLSNIEKRFPPPAGIAARRPPSKLTALRACGA